MGSTLAKIVFVPQKRFMPVAAQCVHPERWQTITGLSTLKMFLRNMWPIAMAKKNSGICNQYSLIKKNYQINCITSTIIV